MHAHDRQSAPPQRSANRAAGTPAAPPHSALAALQRTAGNAAVTRAVQRYSAGPEAGGFTKLSAQGAIALKGKYEAYASDALFKDARLSLHQAHAPITLERGESVEAPGGGTLFRVLPVYISRGRVPHNEQVETAYEPVDGDSPRTRADKRTEYADLTRLPALALRVAALAAKVRKAGAAEAVDLYGEVSRLALDAMGAPAAMADPHFMAMSKERTPANILAFMHGFNQWFSERLPEMRRQEGSPDELLISLPNDCKAAAAQLLGADPTALSRVRPEPQVGQNHYIKFDTALDDGWNNHFAAVIMRDGGDTLTYETAADSQSVVQHGKSLGYFAMYGPAESAQSFAATLTEQNTAYAREQHG
ncbi:hypothetical protein [Streptomyces sp. NPDC050738]|uniref:hypothetical protein n=1 Tax=Streptomyces sp. NPDC050738 TaxID=3154744 RepID=UPI00341BC843